MFERAFTKGTAGFCMTGIAVAAMVAADCHGGAAFAVPVQAAAGVSPGMVCSPSPSVVFRVAAPGTAVLPEPDAATLQTAAMKVHNDARAAVGVEPLLWDDELARGAQYWATMIVKTGVYKHDPDAPSGEEITGGPGGALLTPEQLMGSFIAEKAWFKNVPFPDAVAACDTQGNGPGHYFGLIRRAAYRLGCGVGSTDKDRYRVIVCRLNPGYAPPREMAYPTTDKPWSDRTKDSNTGPWVEAARYDIGKFATDLTNINGAVHPGLVWDESLAGAAGGDAHDRLLAADMWASPIPAGQFMSVAYHSGSSDVTDYPPADVQYRDWLNDTHNTGQRGQLAASTWTRVGCGTAIRPVGDRKYRLVICRYS